MKTLDEARQGWKDLNVKAIKEHRPEDEGPPQLRGLRSVAWKQCLLFETSDTSAWRTRLSESRSAYNALRTHFLHALDHPDELSSALDPLADNTESPWDSLRRDEAIRNEIFQDVERCMPENMYFRQPSTQNLLLDILFVFSKLNADVGYRQGMHELLAPVVWVVERDALDTRKWKRADMEDAEQDQLLFEVLDHRFIEHDAFTLFCLIMQNAKAYYEPGKDGFRGLSELRTAASGEAPILAHIDRIYNKLLPKYDQELSTHLNKLDIVPQVFLMRWMRLLFGREFSFDDTLGIWDALFVLDPSGGLVDFVCVAMLLRIRWQLLQADANEALTLLLRYPSTPSPPDLVQDAAILVHTRSQSSGASIILRRTGRRPTVPQDETARPTTPTGIFPPTVGSPNRAPSPFRSPSRIATSASSGLESLLADAARAAYSRGERWGLSRAVRDAVGDVRKNLSALNVSPQNSLHRRSPSAQLVQKVSRLEARNKALAGMLEAAITELWECQRRQIEGHGAPASEEEKKSADALSVAIAKAQFVQVYLGDATLPLPNDEEPDALLPDEKAEEQTKGRTAPGDKAQATPPPEILFEASSAAAEKPEPSASDKTKSIPEAQNRSPSPPTTEPPAPTQTTPKPAPSSVPTPSPEPVNNRPPLSQSSFSWMLGGRATNHSHPASAKPATGPAPTPSRDAQTRQTFASSSPFTDEGTFLASRPSTSSALNHGFLFGDEDDGGTDASTANNSGGGGGGGARGGEGKKDTTTPRRAARRGRNFLLGGRGAGSAPAGAAAASSPPKSSSASAMASASATGTGGGDAGTKGAGKGGEEFELASGPK